MDWLWILWWCGGGSTHLVPNMTDNAWHLAHWLHVLHCVSSNLCYWLVKKWQDHVKLVCTLCYSRWLPPGRQEAEGMVGWQELCCFWW
jgi:hypothetical protein